MCSNGQNLRRKRRDVSEDGTEVDAEVDENVTIEVFSGLYVTEEEQVFGIYSNTILHL